jgi:hypothetical protein
MIQMRMIRILFGFLILAKAEQKKGLTEVKPLSKASNRSSEVLDDLRVQVAESAAVSLA